MALPAAHQSRRLRRHPSGADHVVEVSDDEVEEAMRVLFTTTHNVVEGAGAAAVAALLQERARIRGLIAGVVLTGANVDPQPFARVLAGQ